jgi:hypothetical protein
MPGDRSRTAIPCPFKLADNFQNSGIASQIFRRSPAQNEDRIVFGGLHLIDGDVGFETVAGTFDVHVPARLEIVHHQLEAPFARAATTGA